MEGAVAEADLAVVEVNVEGAGAGAEAGATIGAAAGTKVGAEGAKTGVRVSGAARVTSAPQAASGATVGVGAKI